MSKKLLLTSLIGLASIGMANATCTPPTTLKCDCAYPIIEHGQLVCGASYCGNKKCMPDGACCETDKYCKVGDAISCCAENETCDTTTGCVEEKDDIETLCAKAEPLPDLTIRGGIVQMIDGKAYCSANGTGNWEVVNDWCSSNGMELVSVYDLCPDWDGTAGYDKCPKVSETSSGFSGSWTANTDGSEAFSVGLSVGKVSKVFQFASDSALCRMKF